MVLRGICNPKQRVPTYFCFTDTDWNPERFLSILAETSFSSRHSHSSRGIKCRKAWKMSRVIFENLFIFVETFIWDYYIGSIGYWVSKRFANEIMALDTRIKIVILEFKRLLLFYNIFKSFGKLRNFMDAIVLANRVNCQVFLIV